MNKSEAVKRITMDDLNQAHATLTKNDVIIDVRTEEEFSEGHVPGARNIPVDTIAQHLAQNANDLKAYQNVYIYCRSGGRVGAAAGLLESQGLKNLQCVLSGGFPNWAARGYPIEF
jgi:rhodanese-related sulfurtransferase